MNDFSSLPSKDWYALGSLVAQLGFLVAAVWFARDFLRAMRAFQEQIGALVKLSIMSTPGERQSTNTVARNAMPEGSPYWLPPVPSAHPNAPDEPVTEVERGPNLFVASWRRMMHWLREPMGSARVSYRRRMINWLQASAGH